MTLKDCKFPDHFLKNSQKEAQIYFIPEVQSFMFFRGLSEDFAKKIIKNRLNIVKKLNGGNNE